MQDVYRHGQFETDQWQLFEQATSGPIPAYSIVSKANLLKGFVAEGPIGLLLEGRDGIDDLAPLLSRLDLIAINFPKFNDGRGFSIARLLREQYGYHGPLRAVGDILIDLIPHMLRVGFTEFTIANEPTRRALKATHLPEMSLYYQPAGQDGMDEAPVVAGRPWLRRAV